VRVAQDQLPDRFTEAVLACAAPIWNGKAVAALVFFEGVRAAGATTLLSGSGADELLCGNPRALRAFEPRARRERALARALLTSEARASLPLARQPVPLARRHRAYLRTVLPASTLPMELGLGRAAGLDLRLPFLDPALARMALRVPVRQHVRAGFGKWALRLGTAGLVPDGVRWAAKVPRLAPAGGGTARARERWRALLDDLLAPGRLAALGIVDPGRVSALLERQTRPSTSDEAAAVADAVLLRLASLVVLAR
jgi:asparagine synthase (glutamine-hydrolysing)